MGEKEKEKAKAKEKEKAEEKAKEEKDGRELLIQVQSTFSYLNHSLEKAYDPVKLVEACRSLRLSNDVYVRREEFVKSVHIRCALHKIN